MVSLFQPEEDDSENDVEAQMSNAEGEEVDEVWVLASMKEDPEILFNGKSPTRNDFVNKAIADYIISWVCWTGIGFSESLPSSFGDFGGAQYFSHKERDFIAQPPFLIRPILSHSSL